MLNCIDTAAPLQQQLPPAEISSRHSRGGFNPYVNNGGTVVCVAGDGFAVGVGDTRLSVGYSIHSRMQSKLTKLTSRCSIASSGMQADINTLHKWLKVRVALFKHQHREEPSIEALAQLLSTVLYSRRFFPYYTFNVLFGIDNEGKGAVYGYDAVGSYERAEYNCAGTGSALVMSILDNQIARNNQLKQRPKMTKEETIAFVRGVLASAGERDIYTGDQTEVMVIDSDGIHTEFVPLRND
ncbi:proteasome subunit beta type 1, putative [Eimeria mitis]|uniref:Proteasome subunit beta type 1, putative n=1 Tax=Eimeria mitis TaxID=44415 RepID=U6K210_9EIME|nr:proteasome subunit beta type 1, putative [Eimeria mitis]CDJ30986.1 proteasome subunit beta type 1, putative [Eimeria mitis]